MVRDRLLVCTLLAALSAGSGCNGSGLITSSGSSDASGDPDEGVDPNDPHNGGEDTDDPITYPTVVDTDGDGIPNEDDLVPCMAFYVKIWNQDVSSASVNLNAQTIVDESFFPTEEILIEFINPAPGINYVDFGGKVTGSPEDQLHTEIWDTAGVMYLHETIVRDNGQPEEVSVSFDINVQC